ncbi:hypothetical protein OPT61_g3564 [Boeremia exigua]|uniref:Uncharacterized protein n=1 Tax=Boeremia exigua TaxID=749465 RepID=A0ACC2IH97_9PLEO|nr:hypothetical protein OPT61_g3564 [Boeremia exigua]
MEVAGLTASIITLIGAATLAGSTVSRIWGLRDSAPAYVLTALNEIEDFKATLQLIRFALEGLPETTPDFIDDEIARFLGRADRSLADFNSYLHNKVLRIVDGESDTIKLRRRAKLKEILGEAEPGMRVLQQELTSIKLSLNTALAARHLRNSGKSTSVACHEVSLIQHSSTATLDGATSTSTTMNQEKVLVAHSSTPSTRQIQSTSTLVSDSGHVHSMMPQWLSELSGVAYFRSLGVPFFNHVSCDLKICSNKAQGAGKMCLQYTFPRWILPYMVQATVGWQTTGGFGGNWTVRIPRFYKDEELSREVGFYMREKSAEDFTRLMAESGLRPFDQIGILTESCTLLELAMAYQRQDLFIMLIESGADISCPDEHGKQSWPALRRHKVYIEASDYISRSIRHNYLMEGTLDQLTTYLQQDPQAVLARDTFGYHLTLLHWAVMANLPLSKVRALLNAGADVRARCNHGLSSLMWAVQIHASAEMCELLLSSGADINEVGPGGDNVLGRAISRTPWHSREDIVKYLLQAGADVHYTNPDGETALHLAVKAVSVNVCRLLVDFGAAVNKRDHIGWFPVTTAIFLNHHQAIELLIQRGARLDVIHDDEDYFSTVLLKAAMFGDTRTMQILTLARISGVRMDSLAIRVYWTGFKSRNDQDRFYGTRAPLDSERQAFQRLLDSVTPLDLERANLDRRPCIPGTFLNKEVEGGARLPAWVDERMLLEDTSPEKPNVAKDNDKNPDAGQVALENSVDDQWYNPLMPQSVQILNVRSINSLRPTESTKERRTLGTTGNASSISGQHLMSASHVKKKFGRDLSDESV